MRARAINLRRLSRLSGALAAACILALKGPTAAAAESLPAIPTTIELVADSIASDVIHGWHSNRLLMHKGVLYADGSVDDPEAKTGWKTSGIYFSREPDGTWKEMGRTADRPYISFMAPEGRMWIAAPSTYVTAEVLRMKQPLGFGSFEQFYNGTSFYLGASISQEGNFLILHAESSDMQAFNANALIGGFYDHKTGTWHRSRIVTPEGRYGYVGIILQGREALAVLNSAIQDPKANPVAPHYSWRHVRLARCDDLTKGQWVNKGFIMSEYGNTSLQDLMVGPDGSAYLAYSNNSANTYEELKKRPMLHYIARIHEDLSTEVFPTGLNAGATRILNDSKGGWYIVGRPGSKGNLHLWRLDPANGFKPTREWELPDTAKLEGYVIHTLRPVRFGGETDGDTIHLMTAQYIKGEGGQKDHTKLWHATFRLPVAEQVLLEPRDEEE
jgi:hypothetical protein